MTIDPRPHFRPRLDEDPAQMAAIRQALVVAMAQGEFPGRRGMPEGHEAVLFVGKANSPIAFATFVDGGHKRVWLDLLYVRPEHRRQGHARRLLAAVEEAAKLRGFDEIVFGTTFANAAMRALGAAGGFDERYIDLVKAVAR